jgi:hypothetical protein
MKILNYKFLFLLFLLFILGNAYYNKQIKDNTISINTNELSNLNKFNLDGNYSVEINFTILDKILTPKESLSGQWFNDKYTILLNNSINNIYVNQKDCISSIDVFNEDNLKFSYKVNKDEFNLINSYIPILNKDYKYYLYVLREIFNISTPIYDSYFSHIKNNGYMLQKNLRNININGKGALIIEFENPLSKNIVELLNLKINQNGKSFIINSFPLIIDKQVIFLLNLDSIDSKSDFFLDGIYFHSRNSDLISNPIKSLSLIDNNSLLFSKSKNIYDLVFIPKIDTKINSASFNFKKNCLIQNKFITYKDHRLSFDNDKFLFDNKSKSLLIKNFQFEQSTFFYSQLSSHFLSVNSDPLFLLISSDQDNYFNVNINGKNLSNNSLIRTNYLYKFIPKNVNDIFISGPNHQANKISFYSCFSKASCNSHNISLSSYSQLNPLELNKIIKNIPFVGYNSDNKVDIFADSIKINSDLRSGHFIFKFPNINSFLNSVDNIANFNSIIIDSINLKYKTLSYNKNVLEPFSLFLLIYILLYIPINTIFFFIFVILTPFFVIYNLRIFLFFNICLIFYYICYHFFLSKYFSLKDYLYRYFYFIFALTIISSLFNLNFITDIFSNILILSIIIFFILSKRNNIKF